MKSKRLGRGLSSLVGPAVRVHVGAEPPTDRATRAEQTSSANPTTVGGGTPEVATRGGGTTASAMAPIVQTPPTSPAHQSVGDHRPSAMSTRDSDPKSEISDAHMARSNPHSALAAPSRATSNGPTAIPASEHHDAPASPSDNSLPTGVVMVDVHEVSSSPYQPRRTIDADALGRLAESIRKSGLMQPIVVRPRHGRYELIAGERRLLAAKQVGLRLVPAMVRDVDDREAAELALVENMQREDLDPMERCHGLRNLMQQFGLTQAEVSRLVGVERSTVANLVRLVELEPEIQELVSKGALGLGHAKALLSLPEGPTRVRAAHAAVKKGWTVRKLEQAASRRSGGGDAKPKAVEIADLEERLSAHLGTRVSVMLGRDKKKGKLVIEFYGIDHFEGLAARMGFKGGA